MERLPDNVLVMVLQLLWRCDFHCNRDIAAFSRVCKRMRALALHPDVWRHCKVFGRCVCTVLRQLPCLQQLTVVARLRSRQCRNKDHSFWKSVRCAVASLCLDVDLRIIEHCDYAIGMIRRQRELGRLSSLTLTLFSRKSSGNQWIIGMLFEAVVETPGLESLSVFIPSDMMCCDVETPDEKLPKPSLKYFSCPLNSLRAEMFVHEILYTHAATLECVNLSHVKVPSNMDLNSYFLARLPNLRELTCCCLVRMEELIPSATLRVLNLSVSAESVKGRAAAARLLRSATQLRVVRLRAFEEGDMEHVAELVDALASSGKSGVENLGLCHWPLRSPQLQALRRALPSLPFLQHLEVGKVPEVLLLALTPATTPHLRGVSLRLHDAVCIHAWIRRSTVKTIMSLYPALHLKVYKGACYWNCESCELNRDANAAFYVGVFCHNPTEKCLQDHTDDCQWIHVPV